MEKNAILFKRKMYDKLLKWKNERNGESAIFIQGARDWLYTGVYDNVLVRNEMAPSKTELFGISDSHH